MSANGRKRKETAKKTPVSPNTNAVYPILRPVQPKPTPPDATNGVNGKAISRGQSVHSKPATQPRIVTTVAEFVSEVIPQTSTQTHAQNEPIQWVRIQKCPLNEHRTKHTFVVVVGLARGYQIWMMLENGSCEEVLSERRGALRVAHLLPFSALKNEEKIADERPIFAIVDNNPMAAESKAFNVNFLSLKTGKIVHTLKFNEQILEVASSDKFLLAISADHIYVCDCATLTERFCIPVPPSSDPNVPSAYAIADSFLAYRDFTLNPSIQSCGGRVDEEDHSYSGQMMNAAKTLSKTVTSIGETLVSSFSNPNQEKRGNSLVDPGVVSVVSMNDLPHMDEPRPRIDHYIAHFAAHGHGVGYLAFGNGGRMLFTSNENSTAFNIFLLHPHPASTRLGSVQHIYKLYRGNTVAKVIETAFTSDNRWLAVATNHGTTHVFGISPYGGPVCMRTHGGKFVNKESRFERTAGLSSENQLSFSVHGKQPSATNFVEHPALATPMTARSVVNPRLTRYPPPVVLWSYAKIKQHLFSAENLTAWASDNSPVLLAANRQQQLNCGQVMLPDSQRRIALCFGTAYGDRCATGDTPVLFVMNSDGMLYLYKIEVHKERLNSSGSVTSLNADVGGLSPSGYQHQHYTSANEASGKALEAPIRIRVIALCQWSLTRSRGTTGVNFICPPLHESSPIVRAFVNTPARKKQRRKHVNNGWLQHVEVTTYCGPHRRLWMGPQFSFGVYAYNGHASAELVSPSANQPLHVFTTAQKCCPVLIEKNSNIGILRCDTNIDATSKIVCGSWTSDPVLYGDDPLANLKEQLEDAMRDSRNKRLQPHDAMLSQRSPR
ncbi:BCAS3 domain-containing protein [Aphelenchoides fujianensis]|nr:BCAS3 domain-containing protein [Aphelenchoides fujianensis]